MQPASYSLKTMVFVRMFAEISVFCIFIGLPIVLWFNGEFVKLPELIRALLVVAGVLCTLVLPVYGFITYRVSVDLDGLRTHALFRTQVIPWNTIDGLRLRTAFGWRRYVVLAGEQSVSFPIWLRDIDTLVDQIRSVLPSGGRMLAVAGAKVFAQDSIGIAFTIFKLVAGLLFIGIFWTFFVHLQSHKTAHSDPSDALVILTGCALFTAVMLWRSWVIMMMPRMVSTDQDGLTYKTWFKQALMPWNELTGLGQPFFLLPEGIVVKTKNKQSLLIGNELDAFDELKEELQERAPS